MLIDTFTMRSILSAIMRNTFTFSNYMKKSKPCKAKKSKLLTVHILSLLQMKSVKKYSFFKINGKRIAIKDSS